MFKKLTVGQKISLGFAVIIVLLLSVGSISFIGVRGMSVNVDSVIDKNQIAENLAQKEIDHLNWANAVNELLTDDNVTELHVQTDDHKCAFGKWLYGEERKHAEHSIPELTGILKEIEKPHYELHASAIEIGKHFKQANLELPGILASRQVDHLNWASIIRDGFMQDKDAIEVQTDPTKCALGKWMKSQQAKQAYESGDVEYKGAWDDMVESHQKLHASAIKICRHVTEGQEGKTAAKKVFNEMTLPLLHGTLGNLSVLKTNAEKSLAGMNKAKEVFMTQTKPSLEKVQNLLGKASDYTEDTVDTINKNTLSSASTTQTSVSVISLAAVIAGVVLSFLISRGIVKALKNIINSLAEGSDQVTSAASQVSAASQSLAEGATEQAAGLEETSSSLEEMASMTKQNADNAQQANTLAAEASKAAATGNESMGRMNTAIQDIQKSSDETAKIIKVIDEIAFQTNLLALNAAVEAARAGEAGKGFAVVAEEVRNLAMRSAEAAKDTSAMIEGSVKNANNGVEIASEVSKVLEDIVEGIGKTTDLVGEIAAASQEQAQGIDQVNTAVNQMDKVTQANAANAEESASASEELSAQAEQMNTIVDELSALVGGSSVANNSGNTKAARTLSASDRAFHQIAGGASRAPAAQNSAEKVIPLAGSSDFEGFNS